MNAKTKIYLSTFTSSRRARSGLLYNETVTPPNRKFWGGVVIFENILSVTPAYTFCETIMKQKIDANFLVRGLRNPADFEFEKTNFFNFKFEKE